MPGTVAINNFAQRPTIWRFKNSTVKSFGEYGDLTEDEEKSDSSLGSGLTRTRVAESSFDSGKAESSDG